MTKIKSGAILLFSAVPPGRGEAHRDVLRQ
jgi:hypothetical protein